MGRVPIHTQLIYKTFYSYLGPLPAQIGHNIIFLGFKKVSVSLINAKNYTRNEWNENMSNRNNVETSLTNNSIHIDVLLEMATCLRSKMSFPGCSELDLL